MVREKYKTSSFSILVAFASIGVIGIALVPLLPIQLLPAKEAGIITITYTWPDASARVVEQEVTANLEALFSGLKDIRSVSSLSSKGGGKIDLLFKAGVNRDAVRFETASLIRQIYPKLPPSVSYPLISTNVAGEKNNPLLVFAVNASESSSRIKNYVERNLIHRLSEIDGVDDVYLFGAAAMEIEVAFRPEAMNGLGVSVDEIATAINNTFKIEYIGKGTIDVPGRHYEKHVTLLLKANAFDSLIWDAIPVKKVADRIIYLRDVAMVSSKDEELSTFYRFNGLNTINLVVYAENNANHLDVAARVRGEMNQMQESLKAGYSIRLAGDSTEYLREEINKLALRATCSLLILLALVYIISRQYTFLFAIVVTIAANLLVAGICFYLLQVEIHLYSLAGLTISLGLIIDSSILMIDHISHHGNKNVWPAILGTSLTSVAALASIFFLHDAERLNLEDFAKVIIISVCTSFVVSLLLIPALADKLELDRRDGTPFSRRKKFFMTRLRYERCIQFARRFKWVFIIILICSFGVPIHLLPKEIDANYNWGKAYNYTIGSETFSERIKPTLEVVLGGAFRLFTVHVFERSYYPQPGKTMLHVRGSMPDGCTIEQMNRVIEEMENFISQFEEVDIFETSVFSHKRAEIRIQFKEEYEWSAFPNYLKGKVETKAIDFGGAEWQIFGVGLGFSNAVYEADKTNAILLQGYNYDELYAVAESVKEVLLSNNRVQKVDISAPEIGHRSVTDEYFMVIEDARLAENNLSINDVYRAISENTYQRQLNSIYTGKDVHKVVLASEKFDGFTAWDLRHFPLQNGERIFKLNGLADISKRSIGNDISKSDQQYQLVVSFDFIGGIPLAQKVETELIDKYRKTLPLGFSIDSTGFNGWNKKEATQYVVVVFIIVAIYFICAILFESLLQPLAVVAAIPISLIGAFMTFYIFELNFDQGGFASFIMLSGLSVNAALYIINDFNFYSRRNRQRKIRLYLKALSSKLVPILVTGACTSLGLVPFLFGGQKEVFWFSFAAGTIGGLIFSLIGVLVFLPLFLNISFDHSPRKT